VLPPFHTHACAVRSPIGTVCFAALQDTSPFGKEYRQYRGQVWAFVPTPQAVLVSLGLRQYKDPGQKAQ
jgi:hypothetical protein